MADWKLIQQEYIEGDESIATLAKKYGVNINTCKHHFRREHWTEKREAARKRADEILIETAAQNRSKLTDMLYKAAVTILENICATVKRHCDSGYTSLIQTGKNETIVFDLKEIVKALEKIAHTVGLDAETELKREWISAVKHPEYYSGDPDIVDIKSLIQPEVSQKVIPTVIENK